MHPRTLHAWRLVRSVRIYLSNSLVLVIVRAPFLRETGRCVSEMLARATRHKRTAA